MKKIYLMFISATLVTLVACGGKDGKKDDKKDKTEGEESEEPAEKEAEVDYSYVIPKIDTAALTTEAEILTAMAQVIQARQTDDSLTNVLPEYTGYYTELTNLYSAVLSKSTAYGSSLKGKAAVDFNEKLNAVTSKMYEK